MTRLAQAAALLLFAASSCMPPAASEAGPDQRGSGIAAEPGAAQRRDGPAGLHEIRTGGARPALLYVPASYRSGREMPLVVMLHGAGGAPAHGVELARSHADPLGFILLAPASRAATWDVIAERRYGADVTSIEAALKQVFEHYDVDRRRIAIAGFSDGASYALSLGLSNGGLFDYVLAFSPGFMAPDRPLGTPRIFISHGVQDRVLPIERCSRRIVPQLRRMGYQVDYREFPDGHTVPEPLARAAFAALA